MARIGRRKGAKRRAEKDAGPSRLRVFDEMPFESGAEKVKRAQSGAAEAPMDRKGGRWYRGKTKPHPLRQRMGTRHPVKKEKNPHASHG